MGHLNPVWLRKDYPAKEKVELISRDCDRNDTVHSGPLTGSFYLFIFINYDYDYFTRSF